MSSWMDSGPTHRKWSWADESAFSKYVPISIGRPADGGSNPILEKRAGKWDSSHVVSFSAIRYNGDIYLTYAGNGASGWEIGIAKATSFPNTWERYDAPIIPKGPGAAWDDNWVLYHASLVDEDANEFKIYYTGDDGAGNSKLGLATCPLTSDPTVQGNWTKDAGNPIWDGGGAGNNFRSVNGVLRLGNVYYMMYALKADPVRTDNMKVASSDDETTWTDEGTAFSIGGAGSWDAVELRYATLFWNQGLCYCFYSGYGANPFDKWQIGIALASDNLISYTKYWNNPVIEPTGVALEWNGKWCLYPAIFMLDGVYYVFYTGYSTAGVYSIGVATIP